MMMVWLAASFDYYLINFLVNTFEQVYLSALLSGMSEIVAYLCGGILYARFGLKASIASSFTLASVAGVVILFVGLSH